MKKVVLAALIALCGASFVFGDARECIDACMQKTPKNKHCAAACLELVDEATVVDKATQKETLESTPKTVKKTEKKKR